MIVESLFCRGVGLIAFLLFKISFYAIQREQDERKGGRRHLFFVSVI